MRRTSLAAALLLTALSQPSWSQAPADHSGHHSDQKEAPATAPAAPSGGTGAMSHDMKGDMKGPAKSDQSMMGKMNMMGGRMPMMDMMQTMGMMRQSGDGMETIDRVEGRIAFLRAELKITDAQAPAWNTFADALRANAKALGELRAAMLSGSQGTQSLTDRLATQEKWLAARLDGTRAIKSALADLLGAFSDEQKKSADELLAPHLGMMPMMSAMRGGNMGMMIQGKPMQ